MRESIYIKNGNFSPLQADRILFAFAPITCEKFRGECPIEKNPLLDDYRLLTKINRKSPVIVMRDTVRIWLGRSQINSRFRRWRWNIGGSRTRLSA